MKKITLIIILLTSLLILTTTVAAQITGHATNQPTNVSVTISGGDGGGEGSSSGGGSSGGGSGGGGSPGQPDEIKEFRINPEEINVIASPGEISEHKISLKNTGTETLSLDLSLTAIGNFVELSQKTINLNPGEEKPLSITIRAPNSGIYSGKIVFTTPDGLLKNLFILINVRSTDALFDVSLTIPGDNKVIEPGQNLKTFLSFIQVGQAEKVDVLVKYVLRDFEGQLPFEESETFAVSRNKEFVKEFPTSNLPPGEYVAGIEVEYIEGFASSSAHFTIAEPTFSPIERKTGIIISVLVILTIGAVAFSIHKFKKTAKPKRK